MLKKSLSKISLVSAGNIFNAILGFAFLTAAAKTLSVEQFGKYALLTSLLVSLTKIIDFGTNSLFVAQSITKSKNLINSFITLKIILIFLTLPISYFILAVFRLLNFPIFIIFTIGVFAYGKNITLFAFFQKCEKFGLAVLLNTLPALIKSVFAVFVLFGLVRLNLLQTFSIFSASMISSALLYIFLPSEFKTFKLSFAEVKDLFFNAAPAGISQFINNGWSAISNSVAKLTNTFANVGIFSLADKIANVFSLISISIFTVLLPKNAERKKDNLKYDFKETIVLSGGIIVLSVVAMGISGAFIQKVFQQKYLGSIELLNILIAASAITAIHTFIENYFYIEEETKTLLFITISKLISFLLFCALLIPIFSIKGIAFSQLISAICALIVTVIGIKFKRKDISS